VPWPEKVGFVACLVLWIDEGKFAFVCLGSVASLVSISALLARVYG